jgi:cytochrome P450
VAPAKRLATRKAPNTRGPRGEADDPRATYEQGPSNGQGDGIIHANVTATATAPIFPPGPPPRDGILANARFFAGFFFDPLRFIGGRFEAYGDIYYAPSGGTPLYVLRHPEHLREVLVTRASSFHKTHSAFERLSQVLGDGLLTSDGETWRRQRRMVQPAFAHGRLAGYASIMSDEARRALAPWGDGEVRDMGGELMQLTLRVVSRTLFGHDVTPEHIADVGHAMKLFQEGLVRPDLLPSWFPSPRRQKLAAALAALDRMTYGIIAARRGSPTLGSSDLLQRLVDAVDEEGDGGRLSEKELRDQLVTLFLAGHETTSHALTWTLYLLSQNQSAESMLHAELDEVLRGKDPTYEDLARLPYTQQVVEESMRLFPPVYSLARRAHEDTEIGGFPVAAGSEVILWVYMTHRDPRWFPNPDVFAPERFAPEEEAKRPKLAYLPFGGGPRACIGKVFAMLEARLLLATLAQRYRFELPPGHRATPKPRITLVPKQGMKMRLRARHL